MNNTKKAVGIGLFSAIVIVLQFLGSFIKFGPFSISLVLVPIVVGTAIYGVWAGGILGAVFGVAVLLSGDASVFLAINPLGTVLVVLLKGFLAGLLAGLIYKALQNINKYFAVIAAAIVCPVVNTGVFLIGCKIFFMDAVNQWASAANMDNVGTYMIVGLVGFNFLFELIANIVLSPVALRIIAYGEKTIGVNKRKSK